jgi:hypothetical protein
VDHQIWSRNWVILEVVLLNCNAYKPFKWPTALFRPYSVQAISCSGHIVFRACSVEARVGK